MITFGTSYRRDFLVLGMPNIKYLAFDTPDGNTLMELHAIFAKHMRVTVKATKPQGSLCEGDLGTTAFCEQQQREELSNP